MRLILRISITQVNIQYIFNIYFRSKHLCFKFSTSFFCGACGACEILNPLDLHIFMFIVSAIWHRRNQLVFEGHISPQYDSIRLVISLVDEFDQHHGLGTSQMDQIPLVNAENSH